jgi:uncharacterized damage-inducible protein DinB
MALQARLRGMAATGETRSMAEDRDSLLEHYRAMRAGLIEAVAGLPDAALVEPSIDGWSVKDHFLHLAVWDEVRASEVARISAGHASAWGMDEAQEDGLNELLTALRRDLSLDQARWERDWSHQRLVDAIATATPRGLDASLYGEAALRSTHEAQHTEWIRRWREERGD